jgi:DNA-binding IclR family transcriptional regulator
MLDRSQIEGIVRKLPLERRTPDTIVDIDRLLARIEVTRRQGYGLNWQENTPGVASVAAAAKDPTGTSPIVLSLGFSTSQTTRARCKELGRLVRSAIDALPDPLRHERGDRA